MVQRLELQIHAKQNYNLRTSGISTHCTTVEKLL